MTSPWQMSQPASASICCLVPWGSSSPALMGDWKLVCQHSPVPPDDLKTVVFLYPLLPFLHSLDRGLPATRGLSTCQKLPVAAKLPTMSFRGSNHRWCGHSCRGSTTKTWQLLQQDSLGSFKTALAVARGGILITSSVQWGQTSFFLFIFFFKSPACFGTQSKGTQSKL